jgi:flagellar basal-body rod modification protein FlgD
MSTAEIISAATQSGSETYVPDKTTLGKDDFLKLLVSQLQNQDPLNPMESTEFTAQLAQFSSLEQLTTMNTNLDYLLLYQTSINNGQAVNFIGNTVKATGNSITVKDGTSEQVQFDLAGDAAEVNVFIYDASDNLIKTINCGSLNDGEQSTEWDGTNDDGETVSDGTYTFEVSAKDGNGDTIEASTYMTVEVTGVTFKEGNAYLLAGDIEISMNDIIEVTESNDPEDDDAST